MNKLLGFEDGWNGGRYTLDGEYINFKNKPKAIATISKKKYPVIYVKTFGDDDDMGHTYSWSRVDPAVMDGNIKKRPLKLMELKNHKIYLELLEKDEK